MTVNKPLLFFSVFIALATLPLGPMLWPPDSSAFHPTTNQIPYYLILSLAEALSFGIGWYFVFEGRRLMSYMYGKNKVLLNLTHISVAWSLLSWWPHSKLHNHIGFNTGGHLSVEYLFHVTNIISAIIIAKFFYTVGSMNTKTENL